MRKYTHVSDAGDKRVKRGFLFLPKTIWTSPNMKQTRWLESATWEETRERGGQYEPMFWQASRWMD